MESNARLVAPAGGHVREAIEVGARRPGRAMHVAEHGDTRSQRSLAGVGTNYQRYAVLLAVHEGGVDRLGKNPSVDRHIGTETHFPVRGRDDEVFPTRRPQGSQHVVFVLQAELGRDPFAPLLSVLERGAPPRSDEARAALDDGLVEEARRKGRRHHREGLRTASGFTKDQNVVRVAPERLDISLDPLERSDEIQRSVVSRSSVLGLARQRWMSHIADRTQAAIDRH